MNVRLNLCARSTLSSAIPIGVAAAPMPFVALPATGQPHLHTLPHNS